MTRRDSPRDGRDQRGQRDKSDWGGQRARHGSRGASNYEGQREGQRGGQRPAPQPSDAFTCGHCGRFVGPLPSGGHNRNHCPYCLYSRHVDAERSGDRASPCGGMMAPIGVFERPNGEEVVVHRCEKCGFERFNRVGADDDEALVAALPRVPPRSAPRAGAPR